MIKKNNKGFSLLEILVAMALVTVMFSLVVNINFSDRDISSDFINRIILAAETCSDEASLKNTKTRIKFNLSPLVMDEDEELEANFIQSIFFEYSLDNKVFDQEKIVNREDLTQGELENFLKNNNQISKNYGLLKDLESGEIKLEENIKILGIGYPIENKFLTTLSSSINFYPSGDKDAAIVFFTDLKEIHYLVIPPFGLNIKYENTIIENLENAEEEEFFEIAQLQAKEIFESIRLDSL